MSKIINRAVINGGLIVVKTAHHYYVFDLRNWNRNGTKAKAIFKCRSELELCAFSDWLHTLGGAAV